MLVTWVVTIWVTIFIADGLVEATKRVNALVMLVSTQPAVFS